MTLKREKQANCLGKLTRGVKSFPPFINIDCSSLYVLVIMMYGLSDAARSFNDILYLHGVIALGKVPSIQNIRIHNIFSFF